MKSARSPLFCVLISVLLSVFICEESYKYLVSIFTYDNVYYFSVYYDAEGPESATWITKDFKANYKTFQDFLQFDLSPCRGVTVSEDGKSITCPDPHKDCYLNKLHACAVDHFKLGPKLNDFVLCMFENTQNPLTQCAGGDQGLVKTLDDCAKGPAGVKLCIDSHGKPPPSKKPLLFCSDCFYAPPFDMVDALCKYLKLHQTKMPQVCNK